MTIQDNAKKINSLNFYFMGFWISTVIGLLGFSTGIALAVMTRAGQIAGVGTIAQIAMFMGLVAMIAALVFGAALLYQLWKLIPSDIARTTPGKAVGLCLIPFFGFYWIFVAFYGLGKDMNETLRQHELSYQVNESLGLIYCILMCMTLIPRQDFFTQMLFLSSCLISCIVVIFFFKSVKNGAIAILEQVSEPQS